MDMLSLPVETSATRLPALTRSSNMVLHLKTGLTYALMPCSAGIRPVYMEAKQTGVTLGITLKSGSVMPLASCASVNISLYFWKSQRATASGL